VIDFDNLLDTRVLAQLSGFKTLWVGLSGGLDSCVLLHQLTRQSQLVPQLRAVHVHHGLNAQADAWAADCQSFCDSLSIPLVIRRVVVSSRANIEDEARRVRYGVFLALLSEDDGLLLAHHADDQAETVLLQLIRGAGIDGLAAMPIVKPLGRGQVIRPLLSCSRQTLETYACAHQLTWVHDDSNQDCRFSRNYLRHQVMPLLRQRWPGVVGNLARSAQHCQQAKHNLHTLALLDAPLLTEPTLLLEGLDTQNSARCANVLRNWLMSNHIRLPPTDTFHRLLNEVIAARIDAEPCVMWGDVCVRRYQQTLYLLPNKTRSSPNSVAWLTFPEPLSVFDGAGFLHALPAVDGLYVPEGSLVSVRFRRGGERFHWRGQTKTLKKLFSQWGVPPWQRDEVPLIYIANDLAAVVGFAMSDHHHRCESLYTYQIEYHR
jgi:tRNA(Ile)-lysidine synthase